MDDCRLVIWNLGFGNIVLVAGKETKLSVRASPSATFVRMLGLLVLGNDKSESMLLRVRDRKRPTSYPQLFREPSGLMVQNNLRLAAAGARNFDIEPIYF